MNNCSLSIEGIKDIIRLSLQPLGLWSHDAEEILIMIASHESKMGIFLRQIGGPALGLYGMEPGTLNDNYENYLRYPKREKLRTLIEGITGMDSPSLKALQYNHIYSTIHARIKLYRSPGVLPSSSDFNAMAIYLKNNYNTMLGKATVEKYICDYIDIGLAA